MMPLTKQGRGRGRGRGRRRRGAVGSTYYCISLCTFWVDSFLIEFVTEAVLGIKLAHIKERKTAMSVRAGDVESKKRREEMKKKKGRGDRKKIQSANWPQLRKLQRKD